MRTVALLLCLALAGCGTPDPCVEDPSSCTGSCAGPCVTVSEDTSLAMFYLWSGALDATPPACPAAVPYPSMGYLETPPDVTCEPCNCSTSAGACGLPDSVTVGASPCSMAGSGEMLALPSFWDGACYSAGVTSPAMSMTSMPLTLSSFSCSATGSQVAKIEGGATLARLCYTSGTVPMGLCPAATPRCTFPTVDGQSVCVIPANSDKPCPEEWPVRHIFYENSVACGCKCGPASGESCSTVVTAYEDTACSQPLASVDAADQAQCADIAPAAAIGSISAEPPTYHAGTCAPKQTKSPPETLCCRE